MTKPTKTCLTCGHAQLSHSHDNTLRSKCTLSGRAVPSSLAACYLWKPRPTQTKQGAPK